MKIWFKLTDLYETVDEHPELEDLWIDSYYTDDLDGWTYNVRMLKFAIPSLHISFRLGDAYVRKQEAEDLEDSEAYDYCSGATVIYEEDEEDIDKYIFAATCDETYAIKTYCEENELECNDVNELDCYFEAKG